MAKIFKDSRGNHYKIVDEHCNFRPDFALFRHVEKFLCFWVRKRKDGKPMRDFWYNRGAFMEVR
jgi:hypothetical protein